MEGPGVLPHRFNVRVYGLLIDDRRNSVLVSKEIYSGIRMTKFPGGGLEFGEGVAEGLQREFMEELGIEIELADLFYINDFLQISAFDPKDQLLSIYYRVRPANGLSLPDKPEAADVEMRKKLSFFWVALNEITPEKFSFPVDKVVAGLLGELSAR